MLFFNSSHAAFSYYYHCGHNFLSGFPASQQTAQLDFFCLTSPQFSDRHSRVCLTSAAFISTDGAVTCTHSKSSVFLLAFVFPYQSEATKELLADEQFNIKCARMVTGREGSMHGCACVCVLGSGDGVKAEFASLSDR